MQMAEQLLTGESCRTDRRWSAAHPERTVAQFAARIRFQFYSPLLSTLETFVVGSEVTWQRCRIF